MALKRVWWSYPHRKQHEPKYVDMKASRLVQKIIWKMGKN